MNKSAILKLSLLTSALLVNSLHASAPKERNFSVREAIQGVTKQPSKGVDDVKTTDANSKTDDSVPATRRKRNSSVRSAIQGVTKQQSKEIDIVDGFKHMFKDGKASGHIRSMYSDYNYDNATSTYATALGGWLKYELAEYKGFNAGVAFTTSYDLDFASGDSADGHRNDELSSSIGHYTEVSEAYINYRYKAFNVRGGRQVIDTPLADSDDVRMIMNTFEGYTLSFEMDAFSFLGGHLMRWQGTDAGLDATNPWVKIGKDGVNFGGITYSNDYVETNLWYYNISNASEQDIVNGADANGNNAVYVDVVGSFEISDNTEIHAGLQYLKESELDNSGVEADIFGAMGEVVIGGLGLNVAYNQSLKKDGKHSFSGYGGGTLFTNMDAMIIDEITEDRDAYAVVGGVVYEYNHINLLYAYGDFQGDADSSGAKAHIVEQNIGLEYSPNDNFTAGAIYVIDDNKEDATSEDFNDKNFRVLISYSF